MVPRRKRLALLVAAVVLLFFVGMLGASAPGWWSSADHMPPAPPDETIVDARGDAGPPPLLPEESEAERGRVLPPEGGSSPPVTSAAPSVEEVSLASRTPEAPAAETEGPGEEPEGLVIDRLEPDLEALDTPVEESALDSLPGIIMPPGQQPPSLTDPEAVTDIAEAEPATAPGEAMEPITPPTERPYVEEIEVESLGDLSPLDILSGLTPGLAEPATDEPLAEKLITFAKRGDLHARRQVLRYIPDRKVVHELFETIGPAFAEREGGYTRIVKAGRRRGDNAPLSLVELVGLEPKVEELEEKVEKKRKKKEERMKAEEEAAAQTGEGAPESGAGGG